MALNCVYRAFDSDGVLLYVGCTKNIKNRLKNHGKNEWTVDMARIHLRFYNFFEVARLDEMYAIKTESPVYNSQGNFFLFEGPEKAWMNWFYERDREWAISREEGNGSRRFFRDEWIPKNYPKSLKIKSEILKYLRLNK